jgi:hypothetical protein
MPAGDYTYYLIAWNDANATTIGRVSNDHWQDFSVYWDSDPVAIWGFFGRDKQEQTRLVRSFIGTDYVSQPEAYEIYDATDIIEAVNAAGGEPGVRQWTAAMTVDPRDGNIIYVGVLDGPACGIHKLRLTDQGVLEPVAEFGDNGHSPMVPLVHECKWYDDYLWVTNWNRTDITGEAIKMDPDTGEIVGSVDLGDFYVQYTIDPETGEETFSSAGPSSVAMNESGVYAVSHFPSYVIHVDYDSNFLWVNQNGDGWADIVYWDHDNNPETGNEKVWRDACTDVDVGTYGFVFPTPAADGHGTPAAGIILGPDGSGIARLSIEGYLGAGDGGPNRYYENTPGGLYDGFVKQAGFDARLDPDQAEANEWTGLVYGPNWVIHIPGRIVKVPVEVGVEEVENTRTPTSYALSQNYPNPFNPSTTIRFDLPEAGHVVLSIYNVTGQEVARLADEELGAGSYVADWDSRDMNGELVSSGVYLYKLTAGDYSATRRMILTK